MDHQPKESQGLHHRHWCFPGSIQSRSMTEPTRSSTFFKPINFSSSMDLNLKNLRRISKELECVSQGLEEVLVKQNNISTDSEISLSSPSCSIKKIELAELAYEEYLITLVDINHIYQAEANELVSRATCLEKEIESFAKMTPDALAKLRRKY